MKNLATNKRAFADYKFLEKFEAGLVLSGSEVKAIREGNVSLRGSFISFERGALYLIGAHIGRYSKASGETVHDPLRKRKLLLKANEVNRLIGRTKEKGLTLVPIALYSSKRWIKLDFAVARGAKQYEKRDRIKKRETDREVRRSMLRR